MPRESKPLKRVYQSEVTINISDIWRNEDIQDEVISNVKKLQKRKRNNT